MLLLRRSSDRGLADHGWLKSQHTFSFADYYDPSFMGFSDLRVINEDRVAAGAGFGTHGHRDMEIISVVIEGAVEHKDSMGNSTVIRPGEVQRMSAGTGVRHSEYNPLTNRESHFLQIWILPDRAGHEPGYGQIDFSKRLESEKLVLAVSDDGRDGSISIHQDAEIYLGNAREGDRIKLPVSQARKGWLQMISGSGSAGNQQVSAGDGLAIAQEPELEFVANADTRFLFFNLRP